MHICNNIAFKQEIESATAALEILSFRKIQKRYERFKTANALAP
jgi:hypothetical protein